MPLSRRIFVNWLGRFAAGLGLAPRLRAQSPSLEADAAPGDAQQGASLDLALLQRLAEAVLPSVLGTDGAARVARRFRDWGAGYRPNAELVHPYGSATIRFTGDSPAPRWQAQLAALDREARASRGRAFVELAIDERRQLVRDALTGDATSRFANPVATDHVAIALMAWYFRSPEAADLCYRARIGRHQCRPLANAPREPLPLAPAERGR